MTIDEARARLRIIATDTREAILEILEEIHRLHTAVSRQKKLINVLLAQKARHWKRHGARSQPRTTRSTTRKQTARPEQRRVSKQ